jgi:hypothetical protein
LALVLEPSNARRSGQTANQARPEFCSEGTNENSPAFQRREQILKMSSPGGTAGVSFQPSLRDFYAMPLNPALKRRAIFKRPGGTRQNKNHAGQKLAA